MGCWVALNWERLLYAGLIAVALVTRLWGLGIRVQSHDESLHTKYSWNLYVGQGFQHTPLMHGPFLFHATALSYFLFGDTDFTARLVVAMMGVAIVAFPYLLRGWLGRMGALVTAVLLLISPSIAYYSRYIRHDIPVIVWALIVVFAVFSYLRDGGERWLFLMAGGVSLAFATKEVAFIYHAIVGFFLVGVFVRETLVQEWDERENLRSVLYVVLMGIAVGLAGLGLGMLSQGAAGGEAQRALPWWGTAGVGLVALAVLTGVIVLLIGAWRHLKGLRSLDLIVVLGTLCLPFLSPILIQLAGLDPMDYSTPTIYYSGAILGAVIALSALIGGVWDWRRWSIAAAIHYGICIVLFTTVFTNGSGIASGLIGSMGYWLAQHGVERGGQPWYYYGIVVPLYEYLPLLLSIVTAAYVAVRSVMRGTGNLSATSFALNLDSQRLFIPFLLWWTGAAWVGYSWAGEKMPWLTVHLALPMVLLGGWGVGRFIGGIDWRRVARERLWIAIILAPPFVMAVGALVFASSVGPFQGSSLTELMITGQFLGSLIATVALGAGLVYIIGSSDVGLSLRVLLLAGLLAPTMLTLRHAWRFCYVNYGYPTEHLVYAHSAPAVKETMGQIEELSRRLVGGSRLIEVAYGADGSWPFHWYLRNYPNATFYGESPTREQMDVPVVIAGRGQWDAVSPYTANEYTVNTYTYLWWPIEDYKGLTWQRVKRALTNADMRAALWRIWYDRDYSLYDSVTESTHRLDEWPLRSDYRLYVRRDVIAQMWEEGALEPDGLDYAAPYSENHVELGARRVIGEQGSGPAQFESPRGVAIDPDGSVLVVDGGNHRVQRFTADGEFLGVIDGRSLAADEPGQARGFNEPWDVAAAPDGSIYVADTWNHRIQRLDAEGRPVTAWGDFGEFSVGDGVAGRGMFYGPRGVAVGPEIGRDQMEGPLVYVTDTGNKRIQVFGMDGEFAFQWGGGGAGEGQLDEPVGIALGPAGEVYVADTWNRRVQVFDKQGVFLREWAIKGWDSGTPEEKPYLAVDGEGHVYVTDPGYYRVLVFNSQGDYLLSFGEYGSDDRSFGLPQGIAVAEDGTVYVSDAHEHRVLIFDAIDFEEFFAVNGETDGNQ